MERLFVSHAGQNDAEAVAIHGWLKQHGWEDVFLSLHPVRGIAPGELWEKALINAASHCEGVIFLISPSWLASEWCLEEFDLARHLNKNLFGTIIDSSIRIADLPRRLKGTYQIVDLAGGQDHDEFEVTLPRTHDRKRITFSREGLERLRKGLAKAGLDPTFFAWPPQHDQSRAPYCGLRPLEAEDAGIFFGRDAPIIEALDTLRRIGEGAAPRLFVILGASGAGKSSFLRAGLLPRLARDDRFLPLPVIRPESAAMSGDAGLVHAVEAALIEAKFRQPRASIRKKALCGAEGIRPFLQTLVNKKFKTALVDESDVARPAIVLAIDQAEELFGGEGASESETLLEIVRDLVKEDFPAVIAVFTIRSDWFDRLQKASVFDGMLIRAMPLLPMPQGSYQVIIEGPPSRLKGTNRSLSIDPQLTQRILSDIGQYAGADALPLLAFTLEQIFTDYGGSGELKLGHYEEFGGIKAAIDIAVKHALRLADDNLSIPRDKDARLALIRRGLIPWLAGVSLDTGEPERRVARFNQIPEQSQPLIDLLVEQRLLVKTVRASDHAVVVEPAHESLLRQWSELAGWLIEDRTALIALESVRHSSAEWENNARNEIYLIHKGARLTDAETLLDRQEFSGRFSSIEHEYLAACREKNEVDMGLSASAELDQLENTATNVWLNVPLMEEWLTRGELLVGTAGEMKFALERSQRRLQGLIQSGVQARSLTVRAERFRHDTIDTATKRLEDANGAVFAAARHVIGVLRSNCGSNNRENWQKAIDQIVDSYGGLKIRQQEGLVPIGRNENSGLWEFLHHVSGAKPTVSKSGEMTIDNNSGIVLILLPGGVYCMGCKPPTTAEPTGGNVDPYARVEEGPPHYVKVEAFFVSKFPMTQGQWLRCTGSNPSFFSHSVDDRISSLSLPVECVSWNDCVSTLSHVGLRLPTEGEWEYAARGATNTIWWCGENPEILRGNANLLGTRNPGANHCQTTRVGNYPFQNRFGLFDVIGNVWEWCNDYYGPYSDPTTNVSSASSVAPSRVCRGGSFFNTPDFARSAVRYFHVPPDGRFTNLGLRPARSLQH